VKEKINDFLQIIPFVSLFAVCEGEKISTPLATRLIETAIMSAVAAGIGMYVTTQITTERIQQLEKKIDRIESQVERIRSDLYIPRG